MISDASPFYTLAVQQRYNLKEFANFVEDRTTQAIYMAGDYGRIYINTELSLNFRHEAIIDDKHYCIELPKISIPSSRIDNKYKHLNVEVKITELHNNEYKFFTGFIADTDNHTLNGERLTKGLKLQYALKIFDLHKDNIIKQVNQRKLGGYYYYLFEDTMILNKLFSC